MPSARPSRDDLIRDGIRLARIIAGRYARRSPMRRALADDIHSAGLEGMLRAVNKFDPARGVPFRAFAEPRIYGAILDFMRKEDHLTRYFRAKAKETGVGPWEAPLRIDELGAIEPSDLAAVDPFDHAARREMAAKIERAAAELPPRILRALTLRYRDDMTLKAIGEAMGFNESRACQVIGEAHAALRDALGIG